ncbi:hypothetical protein [Paracidovorax wautersii]|uniref:Uncharacterized protein n=1 Tax=Paracidovorax wautersii TaxID=1177982 RepID=A0ABU1IDG7_9BURK|nr:hypothetical protein [Paracidovorax wautersii]MDR6215280.1 hypothetical protein [Paracidovorax wautersii]
MRSIASDAASDHSGTRLRQVLRAARAVQGRSAHERSRSGPIRAGFCAPRRAATGLLPHAF